jgi:hypothetical protein
MTQQPDPIFELIRRWQPGEFQGSATAPSSFRRIPLSLTTDSGSSVLRERAIFRRFTCTLTSRTQK